MNEQKAVMTPRIRRTPSFAVWLAALAIVGQHSDVDADLIVPCFTSQNESSNDPFPIVAGFSLLRTTGANTGYLANESFFDGLLVDDALSHSVNRQVGSSDCNDAFDYRVVWGYGIHDETSNEAGTMSWTGTFHMREDLTNAIGCAWTDALYVQSRSVDTSGGGDARHWTESSSLYVSVDAYSETCDEGDFHNFRIVMISDVSSGTSYLTDTESACFASRLRDNGQCPGAGGGCI